ncbi:MAG: hypothetical protein QOH75_2832 [Actinomycetota bacterium]|nr:hypothetical protein [Actinomycetota bacterium]
MSLKHTELVDLVGAEAAVITGLLAGADPARTVPSCPGWEVRDLIGHLGSVHRWATEIVRTGGAADMPEPPQDDELASWFSAGAGALTATLAAADPAASCWSFAGPHTVGFWSRRQLHETMVHRWDLEQALGHEGTYGGAGSLDNRLAADGVDEVVTMFFPRQVRLGRQAPLTDTVALLDASTGRRWQLSGDGTGDESRDPDATVSGDPGDLLLVLWKRRDLADTALQVDGDQAAVQRVLGARLTP